MNHYDELEHEGNEDFNYSNRAKVKTQTVLKTARQTDSNKEKNEELERKQKEYLNIDNPALWDGDIDD